MFELFLLFGTVTLSCSLSLSVTIPPIFVCAHPQGTFPCNSIRVPSICTGLEEPLALYIYTHCLQYNFPRIFIVNYIHCILFALFTVCSVYCLHCILFALYNIYIVYCLQCILYNLNLGLPWPKPFLGYLNRHRTPHLPSTFCKKFTVHSVECIMYSEQYNVYRV